MSLPQAVLAAEAKAEELYAQMYSSQEGSQGEQQTSTETAQAVADDVEPLLTQGIEAPDTAVETVGSQEESPVSVNEVDDDSWENRYKILTGKYSAEVPALAAEKRELRYKLNQLEKELERVKSQPAPERLVKDEEIQEYGESLVDLIRRAAREEIAAKDGEIDSLKSRLEGFEQSNQKRQSVDYYQRLGEIVPDWVAVNDNKSFHRWLSGRDELTGQERQDMLNVAHNAQDAARVAAFFNAWKRGNQTMVARANQSLESQVVPEPSVTDDAPAGKRIWTRGQINEFYGAYRRGEIPDDKALAIESEIQMASSEGRIR